MSALRRAVNTLRLSHISSLQQSSAARKLCTKPPSEEPTKPQTDESKTAGPTIDPEADNTAETNDTSNTQPDELTLLYDATLQKVITHGWTNASIEAAVSDLGWSPASKRMIARGPVQVAEHFVMRCNTSLAEKLALENEKDAAAAGGSGPVGRATFAIRERLEMIEPYSHNWSSALALQAMPQNAPRAVKASALLVDEIAHYAGYRSPDVS